jgi:hypothetical protein
MEEKAMALFINKKKRSSWFKHCGALLMAAAFMVLAISGSAYAQTVKQRTFASPQEAVKAFVEALKAADLKALEEIFGPGGEDLISSGDPVADQALRGRFVKAYEEKNNLEQTDTEAVLVVGNEDWPFPIPIVKAESLWHFDVDEGRGEMLARRIGRAELSAIQVCLAYVDAQREYALKDRDSDAFLEYAQKFRSDPEKKNGLYWETKEGEEPSPLGLFAAAAQKEGYDLKGEDPAPYHGYYYRILKGQGESAPGGAYDYLVNGKMIGGFALVAYPAKYGASGVMTFIVNHEGVVYEKDLGENTEETAQAMTIFNPDGTWKKSE